MPDVEARRRSLRTIPVLSTITAGDPWSQYAEADVEEVPDWGGEFRRWGRVVEGSSMEPTLRSGDIVVFEDRQATPGHVVHAFSDGEDTVKCFRLVKGEAQLWPFNTEEHEPFSAFGWKWKGVAVARIRYGRAKRRSYTEYPGGMVWNDRNEE